MEKTNLKQPLFLKPFFWILNKKYSDFSQKVFGRFRKNRSTCPEEQSMKKHETKKELIIKTISRNLFWQLSDFWWNFSGRFVKTVFYLSSKFLRKVDVLELIFDWYFFWTLKANCHGFGGTFSARFKKLLSTCPKEKRLCCPTFQEKVLFLKVFVVYKVLTDSERNSFSFFLPNFWPGSQSCVLGVQMNNLWKNLTWEKSFEIDKLRGCLLKNLGQLSESFRQFRQNCILPVDSRF